MKNIKLLGILSLIFLLFQCKKEETPTPLADFQFLLDGTKVIFNGTVANANTISWDFGDGGTSNIEDPVHAYATAGVFEVVMTVKGDNGTFTEKKTVTILPSLEILLTGGQAKAEGKTWRLRKAYTAGKEGAGLVENALGLLLPSQENLLSLIGLGSSYDDTFTFTFDGKYKVDNKDGQSLMGLVYASVEQQANIRRVSGDINNVPLANVLYTPKTNATWQYKEGDFTVDAATGPVKFTNKKQLILSEYFGFKDAKILVILKDINEKTMNVALGIHTEPSVYAKPTLLFHLSFEAL